MVEKVAKHAKNTLIHRVSAVHIEDIVNPFGGTYQQRTCGLGTIVKAANDTQTQHRDDGQGIWIDREWAATKLIGQRCGEEHRDELDG